MSVVLTVKVEGLIEPPLAQMASTKACYKLGLNAAAKVHARKTGENASNRCKYVTVVANAQTFVKMFMKKTLLSNYVLFT